jgi:putative MATE family efflux protein
VSRAPEDGEQSALPSAFIAANAASAPTPSDAETDRDILRLTWPVVLGQLLANAVSLIDIFMLGKLGTEVLAAVGYASQFLFVVQACLMAIGSACVAMMSRAIGAGDHARAREAFAATLWLSLLSAGLLGAIALAMPRALLHLLDVPDPIVELAVPYFRLTLGSSLFMGGALAYEHAQRAVKNTMLPMVIAGLIAAVKLALNLLLIFGMFGVPALGLFGAGLATLLSMFVGVVLFVASNRRPEHPALRLGRADLRVSAERMAEALRLAAPAIGERIVMTVAIMTFFRFLGQYGVAAVAAYNVGVRILSFTWIPGLGLSVAASTLVGQALGARNKALARRSGWRATGFGLVLAVVLGAFFIAARVPLARMFTSDPAVVAALDPFILLLGLALPFLVIHFTLGGALRGAGDTVTPLLAATLGNWAFRVPLGYLFAHVWGLSLFWIWSVMLWDHLSRAIWLAWAFHFGRWDQPRTSDAPPPLPVEPA